MVHDSKKNTEKGLVKLLKNAGSDTIALTSLNTLPMVAIELCAGMSLHYSANVRVAVSATNPIFGLARDTIQSKFGNHFPQLNKKSPTMDICFGIAAGATELAVSFVKYYAIRLLNGQDFNFQDATSSLLASGYASLYTMFFGGLMGTVIDTYRDGFGIERKENSRSIFPEKMNPAVKKTITYALSTAALIGMEEFYRRTR